MKTTHRPYADTAGDFNLISRFITRRQPRLHGCSTWCLGRFVDWKYGLWGGKLSSPGFWENNARLWFDGFGELAGFAISENGGPDVAIFTAEGNRFFFAEILQWVLEDWGSRRPGLEMEITAQQTLEAGCLEGSGFQRAGAFYTHVFDLTNAPLQRFPLAEGFTLVDMQAHPDYRAQRILRLDAFRGQAGLSEEEMIQELAVDGYSRESPIYHAQTDLCVVAPDGSFAAGCEALIDTYNAEADIERVCTHSRYRKRGLARAVIQACLDRLRAMGLRRAYITGYSPEAMALYASLGATAAMEAWIYKQR